MKPLLRIALSTAMLFCLSGAALAEPITPTPRDEAEVLFYSMPNDYFRTLLKKPPVVVDGQTLHPKYQYYLEERSSDMSAAAQRAEQTKKLQDPVARRKMMAGTDRNWTFRTKVTAPLKYTQDLDIPGPGGVIHARAYVPNTAKVEVLPVIVYFHGGGWLFASVEAADRAMRLLANEAGAIVVSADYRMAPEHKFPAAHEDAYATYQWVRGAAAAFGGDPKRVAIGGDSAGGNMAVAVSYRLRQEGAAVPALQLLYYPVVDYRTEPYPSYELFGEGYSLDKPFIHMMETLVFASPADRNDLRMSPIQAKSLKGMPPAIVATAGFDLLRDQGRAFADRLRTEGVPVQYVNYPSLIHGWMQWSGVIDDAEKAAVDTARLAGKMLRESK